MESIDWQHYEKRYSLNLRSRSESFRQFALSDMTTRDGADAFIEAYAPEIKAITIDAAATYFASYFGQVCAAFQFALWRDGVLLDLSPNRVIVHMVKSEYGTGLAFQIKEARISSVPEQDAKRGLFVRDQLQAFYGGLVKPLIRSIAGAGGVRANVLWGQLATRMHYIFDVWREEAVAEVHKRRLDLDLDLLFHGIDPDVFGQTKHPFDISFQMAYNPWNPDNPLRIKATCCLAYKTDTGHGYCYTCPRLKESEREKMKQQLLLEQSSGK